MAEKRPEVAAVLPSIFIAELLGAGGAAEVKFTDQVATALAKISPELLPQIDSHPLADTIARGAGALDELCAQLAAGDDEEQQALIIDAICAIIVKDYATETAVATLQTVMRDSESALLASNAARGLALAGEAGFLELQRGLLLSDSPSDQRIAAKLVGYGKYDRAVPQLRALLRPDHLAVLSAAVWALGEIGSDAALADLHAMLDAHVQSVAVIEALGKIGAVTSLPRLLSLLTEGDGEQSEKAAQAIAKIVRANDGRIAIDAVDNALRIALERMIDSSDKPKTVFFCIVAYGLLGGHLTPQRIIKGLGAGLAKEDVGAIAAFYTIPGGKK